MAKGVERNYASKMRAGFVNLGPLLSRGRIMMENMSFSRLSICPHHHDYLAAIGRILDSSRLATIFADLEPAGLLYLVLFSGKSTGDVSCQSGHPASVYSCGMGLASGGMHLQDL
jgi:hypothetical protein